MLRLLLIRHADAAAYAPGGDLARPLSARGIADAARLGVYCHIKGLIPELALVSPALRALDTLAVIMQEFPQKPACETDESLYCAGAEALRELLERISISVKTLLIVGHNPGLAEFAHCLVERDNGTDALLHHFPTPSLALIRFSCADWAEARMGGGKLELFMNFACTPEDDLLSAMK